MGIVTQSQWQGGGHSWGHLRGSLRLLLAAVGLVPSTKMLLGFPKIHRRADRAQLEVNNSLLKNNSRK